MRCAPRARFGWPGMVVLRRPDDGAVTWVPCLSCNGSRIASNCRWATPKEQLLRRLQCAGAQEETRRSA